MLSSDPCSLLDPVMPAQMERFNELARDHDGQGGAITDGSRCEARLALTLEACGILPPAVTRPNWGEAEDGLGQIWDFKSPHSRAAIEQRIAAKAAIGRQAARPIPARGYDGEFEVGVEVRRAIGQQQLGKGVLFDLRRLTVDQARQLISAISLEPRIDPTLVLFFPKSEDLASFEGDSEDAD